MDEALAPPPTDASTFQERYEVLKTIFTTRLANVVRSLKETPGAVYRDEPARVLSDHPDSSVFTGARIEEVVQAALHSEREAFIVKLAEALANREAELRSLSRISGKAQHAWQSRVAQLQEAHADLEDQLAEVSSRAHEEGVAAAHASAALAASHDARERAVQLAEARLEEVHRAEMARSTAEAEAAAARLSARELEARLERVVQDAELQRREAEDARGAAAAAAAELAAAAALEATLREDLAAADDEVLQLSAALAQARGGGGRGAGLECFWRAVLVWCWC
jgi:hypothetical protein